MAALAAFAVSACSNDDYTFEDTAETTGTTISVSMPSEKSRTTYSTGTIEETQRDVVRAYWNSTGERMYTAYIGGGGNLTYGTLNQTGLSYDGLTAEFKSDYDLTAGKFVAVYAGVRDITPTLSDDGTTLTFPYDFNGDDNAATKNDSIANLDLMTSGVSNVTVSDSKITVDPITLEHKVGLLKLELSKSNNSVAGTTVKVTIKNGNAFYVPTGLTVSLSDGSLNTKVESTDYTEMSKSYTYREGLIPQLDVPFYFPFVGETELSNLQVILTYTPSEGEAITETYDYDKNNGEYKITTLQEGGFYILNVSTSMTQQEEENNG